MNYWCRVLKQVVTGEKFNQGDRKARHIISHHGDFTRSTTRKSQATGENQTRVFVYTLEMSHHITQSVHFSFPASDCNQYQIQ